jgi:hypothetical protein
LQAVRLQNAVLDILRRHRDEHPWPLRDGGREYRRQLRRQLLQGPPYEVGGHRRRRQRRPQQPILADGQAVTDGAHSVDDVRHHAANSDMGGVLLHRLSGANPLRKRRPGWVLKESVCPKKQPRELRL